MSDDHVPPPGSLGDFPAEPGTDPHDDAGIAALLASLDTAAPPVMPAEVAARLDAAIVAEAGARRSAPVHHLRKIVLSWGVAAAAVVAVVAGVSVVADNFGIGAGSSSDSKVSADSGAQKAEPGPERATDGAAQSTARPVVRADQLARDATALLRQVPVTGRVQVPENADGTPCPAAREPRPDRQVFAITFLAAGSGAGGGTPAILIVTTGPPRTATVFACDGTRLQQVALD